MAYNASTGLWEDEDAGVQKRVADISKQDSELNLAAETRGLQMANRRGLGNSTEAVGAAQKAVLDVAVPIASQEAGQVHSRNLSGQSFIQQDNLQGKQIASTERMQSADLANRVQVTQMQEGAAMERLKTQGAHAKDLQAMADAAAKDRQGITLTSEERRAKDALDNQVKVAEMGEAGANARNQANINADNLRSAQGAVTSTSNTYANAIVQIQNNPNIPIEERNKLVTNMTALRDSDMGLVEQLYNVDLNWTAPATPPATP